MILINISDNINKVLHRDLMRVVIFNSDSIFCLGAHFFKINVLQPYIIYLFVVMSQCDQESMCCCTEMMQQIIFYRFYMFFLN